MSVRKQSSSADHPGPGRQDDDAEDKKEALADLNVALKATAPAVENKGNIDLVVKYFDKLNDVLGADQ